MEGTFLFLGTGASAGVPVIGCKCPVCTSQDPHDARARPSGLLRVGGKSFLIDIGPDFHLQALRAQLSHIDGLLLTHTHYDHIAGIDEVRVLNFRQQRALPCLLSRASLRELHKRYDYLFKVGREGETSAAQLDCHLLPGPKGTVEFEGVSIRFMTFSQARMEVTGFRIGNFAYLSDIRTFEEDIFDSLRGVEVLVVSALRQEPSHVHFTFEEAAAFARRAGAKTTWLTHISHALKAEQIRALLPPDVQPAYDGLEVSFGADRHA